MKLLVERKVLLVGATSDIAQAIALELISAGYSLELVARSEDKLLDVARHIEEEGKTSVSCHVIDVLDDDAAERLLDSLPDLPDLLICCVGKLGDQKQSELSSDLTAEILRTNFEAPVRLIGAFANHFESRGSGVIVGVSSVAGIRGRKSNYVYGSAKAGFTAYLSGLRNRLSSKNVRVITVLPGFVDTKMIADIETPPWLTAHPREVAMAITEALTKDRNIIYTRRIWRVIMFVIALIPESIFKKLNL